MTGEVNSRWFARTVLFIAVLSTYCPTWASEDAMSCVKEMAIPSAYSTIFTYLPTKVEVRVTIGENGRASAVSYNTKVKQLMLHLDAYFKDRTRYLESCKGREISFKVEYSIIEPALDFGASDVSFEPPDQFFIRCHRLKPSLDPVRPKDLEPQKGDSGRKR